jgi:hypothetical protein
MGSSSSQKKGDVLQPKTITISILTGGSLRCTTLMAKSDEEQQGCTKWVETAMVLLNVQIAR